MSSNFLRVAAGLVASFAFAVSASLALAGGPPPPAQADCVDLRLDCNPYSTTVVTRCGAGAHAAA